VNTETFDGKPIRSLADWKEHFLEGDRKYHWQVGRSAQTLAEFVINGNGLSWIREKVSDALQKEFCVDRAVPELEIRFDRYGRGRVHDLGVFGSTDDKKRVFVGVEAKVDEPFGRTIGEEYLSAKAKQITGTRTNAPARIEHLLALHFSRPTARMFECRYQLLYSTAGTVAAECEIPVMLVLVFRTHAYDATKAQHNKADYRHFVDAIGAEERFTGKGAGLHHVARLGDDILYMLHEEVDQPQI
jgi:hypothetical protein